MVLLTCSDCKHYHIGDCRVIIEEIEDTETHTIVTRKCNCDKMPPLKDGFR